MLALLYVAICKTDYRGSIPWSNSTTDCFLDSFLHRMSVQDGTKSVVKIHKELLADCARSGRHPAGSVSELMRRIEKRAFKKKDGPPFRPADAPVFKITTADLSIVTRAANAVRSGSLGFPLSVTSRMTLAAQKSYDAPKSLEELNELRKKLILRDWRDEIIKERREGVEAEAEAEQEQDAEADVGEDAYMADGDDGFPPMSPEASNHPTPSPAPSLAPLLAPTSPTPPASTPAPDYVKSGKRPAAGSVSDRSSKRPRTDDCLLQ
ncbi:hypothetical protein F4811DRAFT_542782 [Daldinia bambusicola]|nr:hypothetical protein F4811DRAFT_542782 [Daldinia bambusicola]